MHCMRGPELLCTRVSRQRDWIKISSFKIKQLYSLQILPICQHEKREERNKCRSDTEIEGDYS